MLQGSSKKIVFQDGLTDSETDSDGECENNFTLSKRRRTMYSTSESETEAAEEANDGYRDTWTSKNFVPKIHEFTSECSGITENVGSLSKIIDYFQLFVSEEFVEFVAKETNYYWSEKNKNSVNNVEETVLSELYCFFAVSFLMTCNKKLSLVEYWSTDKLLHSDIVGEVMTRDRYFMLLGMLNFTHCRPTDDRLSKICNIIDMLRRAFSDAFQPYQCLCIDESLILYNGRLSFKQYVPPKRKKCDIKSFILSDCKTGYIQDIIVYTGLSAMADTENEAIGKSGAIVMSLLKPYLGKGHTLYLDNWYTSPALFNLLHKNCTNACGAVKKRRKGMPKIEDRLKKGEASFRSSNNLLVIKWVARKEVYMLSTMHTAEFAAVFRHGGEKVVQEPVCVIDYNNAISSVDKIDMVVSTVNSIRKSLKWYRKFFFHLLDICVWNAYCLYKHRTEEPISLTKFQLQLIREILEKYCQNSNHRQRTGNNYPLRLTERHFPSLYMPAGKNRTRRCVVCSKNDKRRESRYECKNCNVGLCVDPCFRIYHTESNY